MKITRIERIALDIPYIESVREHLQKGWGLANRATDEEFAAEGDRFHREWRDSKPPTVKTSLYLVHTDDGLTGLGEGASLTDEQLATYTGRSPFNYLADDSVGPLQMAFYDLMGQALELPLARVLGPARATAPRLGSARKPTPSSSLSPRKPATFHIATTARCTAKST